LEIFTVFCYVINNNRYEIKNLINALDPIGKRVPPLEEETALKAGDGSASER
jgi:hypothetical protein